MADPVDLRVETFVQATDADVVLDPRRTRANVVVTAVLSPGRTAVLDGTEAVPGDVFAIDLVTPGSAALTIRNRAADRTILRTMGARSFARFIFDDASWALRKAGPLTP